MPDLAELERRTSTLLDMIGEMNANAIANEAFVKALAIVAAERSGDPLRFLADVRDAIVVPGADRDLEPVAKALDLLHTSVEVILLDRARRAP